MSSEPDEIMGVIFSKLVASLRGPASPSFWPKEQAYEELNRISGQDWGYDADAWNARRQEILAHWDYTPPTYSKKERKHNEVERRRERRARKIHNQMSGDKRCPKCGITLWPAKAKQCFECGADWH